MATLVLDTVPQPHVLTIAGSDSGGGAGIQADLKTIAAHGCYGSSVITALTAQNTLGVQAVHTVPPEFVVEQLKSLFDDDLKPLAIKFGMLAGESTIAALADYLSALPSRPFLVLDPVMVSTSGHHLLPDAATQTLVSRLLPLVDLVTPNIPEAQALAQYGEQVQSVQDMLKLAEAVRGLTNRAVLLKGGHLPLPRAQVAALATSEGLDVQWDEAGEEGVRVIDDFRQTLNLAATSPTVVVDILASPAGVRLFAGKHVSSSSTHGTGCTLSAALASQYAMENTAAGAEAEEGDKNLSPAGVRRAIEYVQSAIATAHPMGRGHGPLNHSHLTSRRALPPPTAHNPTPFVSHLIRSCPELWDEYIRHPFVVQLGEGTLPRKSFEHYISQDYHYLVHYARAHALGAYKSTTMEDIKAFSEIALHIARESTMHVAYCEQFGITKAKLLATPEAAACAAYARYIIDVGTQGDVLDVYVAVASCLIGYAEVGLWLKSRIATGETKLEGNPYARWVEDYSGEEFLGAVRRGIANLEARVAADPPSPERLARLTEVWTECVRLERNFWEMGLKVLW